MSSVTATYLTPEQYLEQERKAEFKSEYFRGEVFAMAGTSLRHAFIVANLIRELSERLRAGPCNVCANDVRLGVSPTGLYTYPDLMVLCAEAASIDEHFDTITNPIVIIEVLSESTKNYDRGQKFQSYRTLPSLKEYLTVAQDEIHVEQYTRTPDDRWLLTEFDNVEAIVALQSIGVELHISDVYEKIDLPAK